MADPILTGIAVDIGKNAVTEALRATLGLESRLDAQLKRLERKVDAVVAGPYKVGLVRIEDAVAAKTVAKRNELLAEAINDFRTAFAHYEAIDPLVSAYAALHIAIIEAVMHDLDSAGMWATRAHAQSIRAMQQRCDELNDRIAMRVGRLRMTNLGKGYFSAFRAALPLSGRAELFLLKSYVDRKSAHAEADLAKLDLVVGDFGDFQETLSNGPAARARIIREIDSFGTPRFSYNIDP